MPRRPHSGRTTVYRSVGLPPEVVQLASCVGAVNGKGAAAVYRQCIHDALGRVLEEVVMGTSVSVPQDIIASAKAFQERVKAILSVPPEVRLTDLSPTEREKMLTQIGKAQG